MHQQDLNRVGFVAPFHHKGARAGFLDQDELVAGTGFADGIAIEDDRPGFVIFGIDDISRPPGIVEGKDEGFAPFFDRIVEGFNGNCGLGFSGGDRHLTGEGDEIIVVSRRCRSADGVGNRQVLRCDLTVEEGDGEDILRPILLGDGIDGCDLDDGFVIDDLDRSARRAFEVVEYAVEEGKFDRLVGIEFVVVGGDDIDRHRIGICRHRRLAVEYHAVLLQGVVRPLRCRPAEGKVHHDRSGESAIELQGNPTVEHRTEGCTGLIGWDESIDAHLGGNQGTDTETIANVTIELLYRPAEVVDIGKRPLTVVRPRPSNCGIPGEVGTDENDVAALDENRPTDPSAAATSTAVTVAATPLTRATRTAKLTAETAATAPAIIVGTDQVEIVTAAATAATTSAEATDTSRTAVTA